jgi:hypothetical protein
LRHGSQCAEHADDKAHHPGAFKDAVNPHLADQVFGVDRIEPVPERFNVTLHCVEAQAQHFGYFAVVQALAHQINNVALSGCQLACIAQLGEHVLIVV